MEKDNIYGYVNGKPVYSRDEFIYTSRGFEEITNDSDLLKFSEEVTHGWLSAGHKHKFINYYLGNYALDEPYASLTKKEYKRLKELQEIKYKEWEDEQSKYRYENFEGRQLSESEVRMFLNKYVEDVKERWGENHYYTQEAENMKDKYLSEFKNGKVIPVSSYEYISKYGNGTGSYDKTLYSDGSIREGCYGYLD